MVIYGNNNNTNNNIPSVIRIEELENFEHDRVFYNGYGIVTSDKLIQILSPVKYYCDNPVGYVKCEFIQKFVGCHIHYIGRYNMLLDDRCIARTFTKNEYGNTGKISTLIISTDIGPMLLEVYSPDGDILVLEYDRIIRISALGFAATEEFIEC